MIRCRICRGRGGEGKRKEDKMQDLQSVLMCRYSL